MILCAGQSTAQSPFFCTDHPNHGFDCVEHPDIFHEASTPCPDPAVEPCALASRPTPPARRRTTTSRSRRKSVCQAPADRWRLFRGCIRGTLDLSTVSIGDVVFDFLVCVDKSVVGQPLPFKLDFEAIAVAKDAISADVE